MRKILISLSILLAMFSTSCTSWLDVNKNTDSPDWVVPLLRLAPTIAAYEGICYDLRGLAPMVQFWGGYSSYAGTYGAQHYYISGSDAMGEHWRMVYWLQGQNIEDIINDGRERGEYRLAGIALAIKAYSWHQLASIHGDLIVKDAFVPGLLSHSYDNQEYAFQMVRSWARQAIAEFEKADATVYPASLATYDLIYKGDAAKWKKFAYAVLARNYIAISGKDPKYLDSAIDCVNNSFTSTADDANIRFDATGVSSNSNFFGVLRANLTGLVYSQSDWMVQMMTGKLPYFNTEGAQEGYSSIQPINDSLTLDPRTILYFGTKDTMPALQSSIDVNTYKFVGTRPGYTPTVNFFGLSSSATATTSGTGRWLFRDDAPWPLTNYAEVQFIKAEAQFRKNLKTEAYESFKNGVAASMQFCQRLIVPGTVVKNSSNKQTSVIGDKITAATFSTFANAYLASSHVNGLGSANLTLSHIMMQKHIANYPWNIDAWNDLRRYHYDLLLGPNGVPVPGTSWNSSYTRVYHKADSDVSRIYKGFYLPPADVITRRSAFPSQNLGSPCYRLRPRYNSEYMWNLKSLQALTPIPGNADNYGTSVVWFAIPQ